MIKKQRQPTSKATREDQEDGVSCSIISILLIAILLFSISINIVVFGAVPETNLSLNMQSKSSNMYIDKNSVGSVSNSGFIRNKLLQNNFEAKFEFPAIDSYSSTSEDSGKSNPDGSNSANTDYTILERINYDIANSSSPKMKKAAKTASFEKLIVEEKAIPTSHKIEYGIFNKHPNRVPIVMIRSLLSREVHERFLRAPIFNATEAELGSFGLQKTVDYPKSAKTHTYYEGYFHSVSSESMTVYSRNPRTGKDFNKAPAGDFIKMFYHLLREKNKKAFKHLQEKLYESALTRNPLHPYNDSCGYVAKWLSKNYHFADLSVQIHWGSAIKEQELFWHSDAENSLLHFGLTIGGSRILHSKRAATIDGQVSEVLETQAPGDLYLSSSALMNHAPEYPPADFSDRIMAIQSRFLYETSELQSFRSQRTPEAWNALVNILADSLSKLQLIIPTMNEIDEYLTFTKTRA